MDSQFLAQMGELVFWVKVIGWCWLLTCGAVIGEKLFSMYKLKEAGRYFEAGGFAMGFILKGLDKLLNGGKAKDGTHGGNRPNGVREVNRPAGAAKAAQSQAQEKGAGAGEA